MKRLLLVAYLFPPEPAAGALRPGFLARYLPEFGWEATVLTRLVAARAGATRDDERYRVVEAPVLGESLERSVRGALDANGTRSGGQRASPLRRTLRSAREALTFPDRAAGWLTIAIARGLQLTREQRFNAILSTAMPASAHVVGGIVARRLALPWIADYRDLWTGNPYARRSRLRASLERSTERWLIRSAGTITTISQPLAAQLERLHRRGVTVIPNACDPDEWAGLEKIAPSAFELCYTGSMYDGYRTPIMLFEALASLQREGDGAARARILFYGPNSDHVLEAARHYGVERSVELRGTVPHAQALGAQRAASDLLIFLNMNPATAHELGSKVVEYAGARRPILAFGPPQSAMREYLQQRELGWFASDVNEAKEALRSAYRRFLSGDWEVRLAGGVFEARDLARAFAGALDAIA
jgi:Glycosyltransferase Family 4